jgi:hypothetical protein
MLCDAPDARIAGSIASGPARARSLFRYALVGLISPLLLSASSAPVPPAAQAAAVGVRANAAGCAMTFKAHNSGNYSLAVSKYSQVRVEHLIWKNLGKTVRMNAHGRGTWYYTVDLGCNLRRSWRFLIKQFDSSGRVKSSGYVYYNTHTGGTFDIGDLNRIF